MEMRPTKNVTIYCERGDVCFCCFYNAFHTVFVMSFLHKLPLFFQADWPNSCLLVFTYPWKRHKPVQTSRAVHTDQKFEHRHLTRIRGVAGMPSFRSHASPPSASSSYHNNPLPPNLSATNPKPEPTSKPTLPTITTDIRPSRFHEHLDPNSPSLSHLPSFNPQMSTHRFIPHPPPPKHDQKILSHVKTLFKPNSRSDCDSESPPPTKEASFKPTASPQRLRLESPDPHKLRITRLELASKLQQQNPETPLFGRADMTTGLVKQAGQGFTGTLSARIMHPEREYDGDADWNDWY